MPKIANFINRQDLVRAVVEVLLIVVGVLLALAIDAWWQTRQERTSEQAYLRALATDVMTDIDEFEIVRQEVLAYRQSSELMLTLLEEDPVTRIPDNFSTIVRCSTFLSEPVQSTGTIEDLLSTGNLALLEDRGLRRELLGYQSAVKASAQFLDEFRAYQAEYRRIVLEYIDGWGEEDRRLPPADLLGRLQQAPELVPALRRMRFAQRRMEVRSVANQAAATLLGNVLLNSIGRANSLVADAAPSAQFESGCREALEHARLR